MAYEQEEWIPLTGLGRAVAAGEITSIDEVLASGHPIKEPQIVDALLPDIAIEDLSLPFTAVATKRTSHLPKSSGST